MVIFICNLMMIGTRSELSVDRVYLEHEVMIMRHLTNSVLRLLDISWGCLDNTIVSWFLSTGKVVIVVVFHRIFRQLSNNCLIVIVCSASSVSSLLSGTNRGSMVSRFRV